MQFLPFPYFSLALGALLVGVFSVFNARCPRRVAVGSVVIALGGLVLAAHAVAAAGHQRLHDPWLSWFEGDALDAPMSAFFAALALLVIILAPRRDVTARHLAGLLLITLATIIAYAGANLIMFTAGWWLASLPFVCGMFGEDRSRLLSQGFLIVSCAAVTAAAIMLHQADMVDMAFSSEMAFGLFIVAVALRKGMFPVHGWMLRAFESGPLLPLALLFNGHLGAMLIVRPETAVLPEMHGRSIDILSMVALATALITSVRSFAERKPRRILGLLCVSQASFIFAGFATAGTEGITGSLIHWLVVSAASTGLICIVRVLEVRVAGSVELVTQLGLAAKAPRLATLFLLCGLAMVGLPGTLGYCAEDLLFHGALKNHPLLGVALPVATAFNAINLLRIFKILFLGVLPRDVADIPDALPRERWPLTVIVVFLVFGGIFPSQILRWRGQAAQLIETSIVPGAPH